MVWVLSLAAHTGQKVSNTTVYCTGFLCYVLLHMSPWRLFTLFKMFFMTADSAKNKKWKWKKKVRERLTAFLSVHQQWSSGQWRIYYWPILKLEIFRIVIKVWNVLLRNATCVIIECFTSWNEILYICFMSRDG